MGKKKMDLYKEDYDDGYYHIGADLEKYPDAVVYIVFSNRSAGKTYGLLRYCLRKHIQCIYMKRTNDDIDTICNESMDMSPYKPLCRDFGVEIHGRSIKSGIGGFWSADDSEDEPLCYAFALNALKHVKGIECSGAEIMCLDEAVPTLGDVKVNRKEGRSEGEQCLDIYMSCNRDRVHRGRKPLKLVLMSNTDEITCPVYETLEVVDTITEMIAQKTKTVYLEDRAIFIRQLMPDDVKAQEEDRNVGMGKVMKGTAWFDKAYGGEFSGADFSDVRTRSIKGYRCIAQCIHKRKPFYIYYNPTTYSYYFCDTPHKADVTYDFSRLSDRRAFADDLYIPIRNALMAHRISSQKYSYWDLIVNFTQKYKV